MYSYVPKNINIKPVVRVQFRSRTSRVNFETFFGLKYLFNYKILIIRGTVITLSNKHLKLENVST